MKKQSKSKTEQLTSVPKGKDIVRFWTRKAGPFERKKNHRKKISEEKWYEENSDCE